MYETLTVEDWMWLEKLAAVAAGDVAPDIPAGVAGRLVAQGFIARSGKDVLITREGQSAGVA